MAERFRRMDPLVVKKIGFEAGLPVFQAQTTGRNREPQATSGREKEKGGRNHPLRALGRSVEDFVERLRGEDAVSPRLKVIHIGLPQPIRDRW